MKIKTFTGQIFDTDKANDLEAILAEKSYEFYLLCKQFDIDLFMTYITSTGPGGAVHNPSGTEKLCKGIESIKEHFKLTKNEEPNNE